MDLWNKPEIQALGKERIALLQEAMEKSKDKNGLDRLDVFLEYGERLAEGGALTQQQQSALLTAISASMPEEERRQMMQAMQILGRI